MSGNGSLSIETAKLVGLFVESLLFGTFTVLFAISSWLLVSSEGSLARVQFKTIVVALSALLWMLCLVHVSLSLDIAVTGFIGSLGDLGKSTTFFQNLGDARAVAKDVIYVTTLLVSDGFLTYRLFVVWNRVWWIIVVPVLLLIATAICGYGASIEIARQSPFDHFVLFVTELYSLPVATNLVLTLLIAGRFLWSRRRTKAYSMNLTRTSSSWSVLEPLIESAALTAFALVALLVTYLKASNAQYICSDAVPSLIGIAFTLIIIQVHARDRCEDTSADLAGMRTSRVVVRSATGDGVALGRGGGGAVQVHVSHLGDLDEFEGSDGGSKSLARTH